MEENIPLIVSSSSFQSIPKSSTEENIHTNSNMSNKNNNLSSKDIFRIANQSVDQFLIEIESKKQISEDKDFSLPELQQPHSPVTEPLHVEKNLLDDLNLNLMDLDLDADVDNAPGILYDQSVHIISNHDYSLIGPKTNIPSSPLKSAMQSPVKSPKRVKIDDSPNKILEFDNNQYSDIDTSTEEIDKLNSQWSNVSIKPFDKTAINLSNKFSHLVSKPLPEISHSNSDYSVKSMPNLNYENDSDDSELTLAPSPVHVTSLSNTRKNLSTENKQFYHAHNNYIANMENKSLIESDDIMSEMLQKEKSKNDFVESTAKPLSQQLKNNLLDGFQVKNDLGRTTTLKSIISIPTNDCQLQTKHLNLQVDQTDLPDQKELVKLNKEPENYSNVEKNVEAAQIVVSKRLDQHKRSSSLSDFVGNIIRSFSSKNIVESSSEPDEEQNKIKLEQFSVPIDSKKSNVRNISVQSVATTITESGFITAEEAQYSEDDEDTDLIIDNNQTDEEIQDETMDTVIVTPKRESNDEELTAQSIPAMDVDNTDNTNESELIGNSSFKSDDFILHVPFEDDVFDNEFNAFNTAINSRNVSNSSVGSKSRIISIERTERNEMLDIWSRQKTYNLPIKKHTEFDSIHTPIKSCIITNQQPKTVKLINNIPKQIIVSDKYSPSAWIYHKLEILPDGVNKNLIHANGSHKSSTSNLLTDTSKVFDIKGTDLEDEHLASFNNNDIGAVNDLLANSDSEIETPLVPVVKETELITSPKLVDDKTNYSSMALDLSWDLSDDSNIFSQMQNDSILNVIKGWRQNDTVTDQMNSSTDLTKLDFLPRNDSNEILKQLWHDNSNDNRLSLTHSDTFQRMSSKNIENYLNKRRMVSDEYNIKHANGSKIQLQNDSLLLPEQRASFYQYSNTSFSKIIPELGIAEGCDDIDGDLYSLKTQSAHFDLIPESLNNFQELKYSPVDITPPKSPISPARQKMIEKFEEQMRQKKAQEAHKLLQQNLQSQIREEAKTMNIFSPFRQQRLRQNSNGSVKFIKSKSHKKSKSRIHSVNEDSLDDIYETFSNSPTKIPFIDSSVSKKQSPGIPKNLGTSFDNPFESPKINRIVATENVLDKFEQEVDNDVINPFENDKESANFEKISSISKSQQNDKKPELDISSKQGTKLVNGEQGRLFVRLQDVGGLRLPDLKKRNAKIQIVLDNGIHCIKTDYVNLGNQTSFILDKEFELIVAEKLNLIITFKLKYDKLKAKTYEISEKKTIKSKTMMGKIMGKKETKIVKKMVTKPVEEDILASYVASDGSFGKLKINFDDYKEQIFAKPSTYSLTCFNEWKTIKNDGGKVKNFNPIPICTLKLKMMFIPRTSEKEILPLSIMNAIAQVQEARKVYDVKNQGYMSQEGGDVEMWTKRFYKLENYDLFAYNVNNDKLKAKINLKKVIEVSSPSTDTCNINSTGGTESVTTATNKRNFSDSLILNNGFRLKFINGETIDFGCDNEKEKNVWIGMIEQLIMRNNFRRQPWLTTMVDAMKDIPISSTLIVA